MVHTSCVDCDGIQPRHESSAADSGYSDFHRLLLDDRLSQKTSIISSKHYGNQSVDSDFEHPVKELQGQSCWTPFPLRRHVLLGFILVFASLFAALAALFSYSQSHQGLSAADERLYYLWTFGPTAVLAAISAFWVQVVYRTKQLMPWKAMAAAAQPPSKSILLDYISPTAPVALCRAVFNAHWTVILSILSTFIVIALTVSSTGLFVLGYVDVTTHDAPLLTTNEFSFDNFKWGSTDVRSAGIVYATTRLGLKYPSGTTAQYAVQDFSAPRVSNATLTAVVDVFSAHLECEPANLHLTDVKAYAPFGLLFHSGATFNTKISSSDCTIAQFKINSPTMLDSNTPYNGTQKLNWGYGQLGTCTEDSSQRVLVSAGTYIVRERWNGTESDEPIGLALPYNKMFQIINSTNILCKPHYNIEAARVVKRSHSTTPSQFKSVEPVGHVGVQQDGDQATEIARAVFQSVSDAATQDYFVNSTLSYNTFFDLLQSNGPSLDLDSVDLFWQQHDNLARQSSALYQSIAAQMAALKLLAPANHTILGQMIESKPRLLVRALSFGLMEAGFVSLMAISVYFIVSASNSVLSSDPGTIDGLAVILSKNSEVVRQVDGKECYQSEHLHAALKDNVYRTGPFDGIVSYRNTKRSADDDDDEGSKRGVQSSPGSMEFWEPVILAMPTRISIILCTLIFAIILEILLATSQSLNGIVAIDTNSWLHYGWTYIPALLMVALRVTYDIANFSVKMINPYMNMQKGSVPANVSIQDHPLSRTSLHELAVSGKRRQVAVFFTTIAALLASLLPIAVSGLYTVILPGQDIKVHQLTAWNFDTLTGYPNYTEVKKTFRSMNQSYPGDYDSTQAIPLVTSLVISANLSYPSWTYDELALPLINASATGSQSPPGLEPLTGVAKVTLPAVRGSLNCSVVSHDIVEVEYPPAKTQDLTGTMVGNRQCLNYTWVAASEEQDPDMGCPVARISMHHGSSLDGCSFEPVVVFLPTHGEDSQHFGYLSTTTYFMNYTYCPTVIGMFGRTNRNSIEDYTWFGCSTEVDRVDAQTTFTLPDYTISSAHPDEATASHLDVNASYWPFYHNDGDVDDPKTVKFTGPNAVLGGMPVDPNGYLDFFNMTDGQNYDNFFSSLVYGRDGVPPSEMLGEANVSRLFAAVQHLWRLVYAQQFTTSTQWMTVSPHDLQVWAPHGPWNGTLMNSNGYRLQQSVVSTRILQGILIALALCGTVAFVSFGSTSRLLPNNPSSIAVVASLLARSEILRVIERRQALDKIQEKHREDPWAGYLFSLGWWSQPDNRRRFGIDIGRADPLEWPLADKRRKWPSLGSRRRRPER